MTDCKFRVNDIRHLFARKFKGEQFVHDNGNDLLEIQGASFVADEDSIFGRVDKDYIGREMEWYGSRSLNVNDIPGKCPAIWKRVATPEGIINSNYGHLVFGKENHNQFKKALNTLLEHRESRRALMIYQRPTMHEDFNQNGMSDFICTNDVQYLIRDGKMNAVVQMRSNDAWAGFRNDLAWQKAVLIMLVEEYNMNQRALRLGKNLGIGTPMPSIEVGKIHWQVGSLHVYHRQFYLVENFIKTGEWNTTKKEIEENS